MRRGLPSADGRSPPRVRRSTPALDRGFGGAAGSPRGPGGDRGGGRRGNLVPMRRLVPILCALAAAGCGSRAPDTATKARDAVRVFLVACAQDDPQAASEVLTEP